MYSLIRKKPPPPVASRVGGGGRRSSFFRHSLFRHICFEIRVIGLWESLADMYPGMSIKVMWTQKPAQIGPNSRAKLCKGKRVSGAPEQPYFSKKAPAPGNPPGSSVGLPRMAGEAYGPFSPLRNSAEFCRIPGIFPRARRSPKGGPFARGMGAGIQWNSTEFHWIPQSVSSVQLSSPASCRITPDQLSRTPRDAARGNPTRVSCRITPQGLPRPAG